DTYLSSVNPNLKKYLISIILSSEKSDIYSGSYFDWTNKSPLEIMVYAINVQHNIDKKEEHNLDYLFAVYLKDIVVRCNNLDLIFNSPAIRRNKQ
ncbi:hypothetical protein, partial [Brevibacillus borstelensis]|uniref:hypothetical protein n=1 Tax=Brevibacillus borstelensis TaxID=45462 RepID=UPI0030BC4E5C